MTRKATITVNRPREGVERLWASSAYRPEYIKSQDAGVIFRDAPGDRGTEIHVDLDSAAPGGRLGETVLKLAGKDPRAGVMDDLRRFKQHVETGVITRSDATPEGEAAERKLKQRPAQPPEASATEAVGA